MWVSGGHHVDFLATDELFTFSILSSEHESVGGIQSGARNIYHESVIETDLQSTLRSF
jgi:hypothetical protein